MDGLTNSSTTYGEWSNEPTTAAAPADNCFPLEENLASENRREPTPPSTPQSNNRQSRSNWRNGPNSMPRRSRPWRQTYYNSSSMRGNWSQPRSNYYRIPQRRLGQLPEWVIRMPRPNETYGGICSLSADTLGQTAHIKSLEFNFEALTLTARGPGVNLEVKLQQPNP